MTLQFHYHPLSSYCHKALVALYENGTRFEPILVNIQDPQGLAEYKRISPLGKMPAFVDEERGGTAVWEATILIDYLDLHFPGATRFIPAELDIAWRVRMWDRFIDLYIHNRMQAIVANELRPADRRDQNMVEETKAQMQQAYDVLEAHLGNNIWAMGDGFCLVDCAAAPALFYGNIVAPLTDKHVRTKAYLERLMARPSYARALEEAKPFFRYYPLKSVLDERYPALAG